MAARASTAPSSVRGWLLLASVGLLGIVGLSVGGAASYVSAARWVDHTLEVRKQAYEWLSALLDAQVASRAFVTGQRQGDLEAYEHALIEERLGVSRVRELVADNAVQIANVDAANQDAEALRDRMQVLVELVEDGHREEAVARLDAGEGRAELDAFRRRMGRLQAEEDRLLAIRREQARLRGWLTAIGGLLLVLASSSFLLTAWRREQTHRELLEQLAVDARGRVSTLSNLSAALADTRSRAQVAEVVVEQGMRAAAADTCTLYMLDEAGKALELIGERGCAPEVIERVRRITETSGAPESFAAMKAGVPTWAESEADYAALHPGLARIKEHRARAFWSVPLVAEDRTVGLLGAGFYAPRVFSADERALVQTIANQCAQALLRSSRLEREEEARRWLSTVLRSIGDAVIATDAEGRITFMNPVAEGLTSWNEGDARGRPLEEVFDILSEQTREPAESPVSKVLREGAVVGLANHRLLRSRRGLEIPIDDRGAPIRNEAGKIVGVVLVFRDATQEKRRQVRSDFLSRAGEALAASLDYESTLATVARLAVPALADWCSVELADRPGDARIVLRRVAIAHVDPSKVALVREVTERFPVGPEVQTGAARVVRTGEPELIAEVTAAMIEAAARGPEHLRVLQDLRFESAMIVPLRARGRVFGAMTFAYADSGRRYGRDDLGFAEDFARRAALAIENAQALREAESARFEEQHLRAEAELASRSKDDFLATVSHELRTPLHAILAWAVMLRSRQPPEGLDRGLAVIERNARAQAKLIEDILDLSRIVSGKLALNLGPTQVAEAVAAAVETVRPAALGKEIAIEIELGDRNETIVADADRLQQVVWNLVSNAVKFTPKGGRVSVRVSREGGDVFIRVSDTGEGIRAAVLPVIFERFQQADASTTRRHGGLGLGLAIVKQLVAAHGGSVRAESAGQGLGAMFVVQLPARSAVAAVRRPSLATSTVEASALPSRGPRLDGLRLLVIDDEPDAREVVGEVLRERGAKVELAGSASEALDKFAAVRPDVVVSDIGMPEADGYTLIRWIRALPPDAGGRTPAVALTAYSRAEDAQRAFVAGYQMHVAKPIEPAQLATVVANLGGIAIEDT